MYDCFSPDGTHRVRTDFYGEACLYHSIGYTVFDFNICFKGN